MLLYPFLAVMNITLRNQDSYQEQKKRRNKDGYRGFPWIYFWVVPLAGTLVGMTQVLPVRCQLWRQLWVEYFTSTFVTQTAARSGRLLILLWKGRRASFHP